MCILKVYGQGVRKISSYLVVTPHDIVVLTMVQLYDTTFLRKAYTVLTLFLFFLNWRFHNDSHKEIMQGKEKISKMQCS